MAKPPPPPGSIGFKVFQVITKVNKVVYRATKGRVGNVGGMQLCIVHNRGAKSGQPRETPLTYMPDGDNIVLIASYGGAPKSPAWFHNLMAHPDIEIERRGKREPFHARRADAAERAELWPRITGTYGGYGKYQELTEREIPVVICAPRSA